jgi:hypothetical protein
MISFIIIGVVKRNIRRRLDWRLSLIWLIKV